MSFVGATLKFCPSDSTFVSAPKYSAIFSGEDDDTKRPHMRVTVNGVARAFIPPPVWVPQPPDGLTGAHDTRRLHPMYAALGIVLIVAGAILTFAVDRQADGVDIDAIGWILMAGGGVALLVALFQAAAWA